MTVYDAHTCVNCVFHQYKEDAEEIEVLGCKKKRKAVQPGTAKACTDFQAEISE